LDAPFDEISSVERNPISKTTILRACDGNPNDLGTYPSISNESLRGSKCSSLAKTTTSEIQSVYSEIGKKERLYVCNVSSETGKCLRAKTSYASERDLDLPPSESAKKNRDKSRFSLNAAKVELWAGGESLESQILHGTNDYCR
jgi:hypothetical protein